ncbi:MAG: hypothetical protein QOD38_2159 [Acidimicrobiaceae bacterium]
MRRVPRSVTAVAVAILTAAVLTATGAAASAAPTTFGGDAAIGPAAGAQDSVAISRGTTMALAAWSDARANVVGFYEGETSRDIYGIRLDLSGSLLESVPFHIAAGPASQERPQIAWNGTDWLVVFESYDVNGTGYYYQRSLEAVRVSPAGTVLDSTPIKIYGVTPSGSDWAVASDGTNWVVTYQSGGASGDIGALRIAPNGQVLDPPTVSLLDATYYVRSHLRVAFAGGTFLLTFDDAYVGSTFATTAIRFDPALHVLSPGPFTLNDRPLGTLTSDGSMFYAAWIGQTSPGVDAVKGSRIDTNGLKLDPSGDTLSASGNPPDPNAPIDTTWDGTNWRITWGTASTLRAARVTAAGTVLDPGGVPVAGPAAGQTAGTGNGAFLIAWDAWSQGDSDVRSAAVSGVATASSTRPLSIGAPRQLRPDVAFGTGGAMLVYRSSTATTHRVMARPLDAAGVPLAAEPVQLDSGSNTSGPDSPTVAWNGSVYLVAWANSAGIVAQRLLPNGTKVDPAPFTVMTPGFGPADVAAAGSKFLVTARRFASSPEYIVPIAARVEGASGAVLDATALTLGASYVRTIAVTEVGGRWLAVWHRNATHDNSSAVTAGAFVAPDGTATPEFIIDPGFSTSGGNGIFEIGLASNGSVALMVQSKELSSGFETDLLAHTVSATAVVGPGVNLTPWVGNQYKPRVAWDGARFVVAFHDERNQTSKLGTLDARSDLFGMRVTATGSVIDPQGFLFSASPFGEADPNVAASGGVTTLLGAVLKPGGQLANYRLVQERFGSPTNQWPVANATATPAAGDVPLPVTFSSAGSTDLDGTVVSSAWDFGDGTTSTATNPSHTFTQPGTYVVRLTVTDNAGATTAQTALVVATKPNVKPVAAASAIPSSGAPPLDVVFYADGSYDPDGFIGNVHWTFGDGWDYWGSPAYHTFTEVGVYTVTVEVFDSRGASSTGTVTVNVGAGGAPPKISVTDTSVTEGNAGTAMATFTVTLSAPSTQVVTVNYAAKSNSAWAPGDFVAGNGKVTFNPGETAKPVVVSVNGDTLFESNEKFTLSLSGAVGATMFDTLGYATIVNDDAKPMLSVSDVTVVEGNAGTKLATFTVSLSAPSGTTTKVKFATASGTALSGSDFVAVTPKILSIPAGQIAQTFTVTINGDTVVEPDEWFVVNFSAPVNAIIADGQALGTISNDDP